MNLSNYRKLVGTEITAIIGALTWLYTTSANPTDYHTWLYVAIMLLTGFGTWISPPNDPGFIPPFGDPLGSVKAKSEGNPSDLLPKA